MLKSNIRWFSQALLSILLVAGCATTPFKTHPKFQEAQGRIRTIAVFPLQYSEDGREQRAFGSVFWPAFQESLKAMRLTQPIAWIGPDSTLKLFETRTGSSFRGQRRGVLGKEDTTAFTVYRWPTFEEMKSVSPDADAILFSDLRMYNEAGAGGQVLMGSLFGISEKNIVIMRMDWFETATAESLWKYIPRFEGGLGPQRERFTREITKGFRKYFPFSAEYEAK